MRTRSQFWMQLWDVFFFHIILHRPFDMLSRMGPSPPKKNDLRSNAHYSEWKQITYIILCSFSSSLIVHVLLEHNNGWSVTLITKLFFFFFKSQSYLQNYYVINLSQHNANLTMLKEGQLLNWNICHLALCAEQWPPLVYPPEDVTEGLFVR